MPPERSRDDDHSPQPDTLMLARSVAETVVGDVHHDALERLASAKKDPPATPAFNAWLDALHLAAKRALAEARRLLHPLRLLLGPHGDRGGLPGHDDHETSTAAGIHAASATPGDLTFPDHVDFLSNFCRLSEFSVDIESSGDGALRAARVQSRAAAVAENGVAAFNRALAGVLAHPAACRETRRKIAGMLSSLGTLQYAELVVRFRPAALRAAAQPPPPAIIIVGPAEPTVDRGSASENLALADSCWEAFEAATWLFAVADDARNTVLSAVNASRCRILCAVEAGLALKGTAGSGATGPQLQSSSAPARWIATCAQLLEVNRFASQFVRGCGPPSSICIKGEDDVAGVAHLIDAAAVQALKVVGMRLKPTAAEGFEPFSINSAEANAVSLLDAISQLRLIAVSSALRTAHGVMQGLRQAAESTCSSSGGLTIDAALAATVDALPRMLTTTMESENTRSPVGESKPAAAFSQSTWTKQIEQIERCLAHDVCHQRGRRLTRAWAAQDGKLIPVLDGAAGALMQSVLTYRKVPLELDAQLSALMADIHATFSGAGLPPPPAGMMEGSGLPPAADDTAAATILRRSVGYFSWLDIVVDAPPAIPALLRIGAAMPVPDRHRSARFAVLAFRSSLQSRVALGGSFIADAATLTAGAVEVLLSEATSWYPKSAVEERRRCCESIIALLFDFVRPWNEALLATVTSGSHPRADPPPPPSVPAKLQEQWERETRTQHAQLTRTILLLLQLNKQTHGPSSDAFKALYAQLVSPVAASDAPASSRKGLIDAIKERVGAMLAVYRALSGQHSPLHMHRLHT